jgi:tetratricopeptide (TPR) repeat protein
MRGMAIVGPHEMPGIPAQKALQDLNTLGNDLFNQGQYRQAIAEYNKALGIITSSTNLTIEFAPADPLFLWNRCAAYNLLGQYRT